MGNITTNSNRIGSLNILNDKTHKFGITYKSYNSMSIPVIIIDDNEFHQTPFEGCDGHSCLLLRTELDISTDHWRMKYIFRIDGTLHTKYMNLFE